MIDTYKRSGEEAPRHADGSARFNLLACAISGRPVEVASLEAGEPAWTDGSTVFIDAHASASRQLASLAVQSSLLGAGSLEAGILAAIARRKSLARRYLAIEGHRVLGVHEHLLPLSVRGLIDREVADRTRSPADSLAIACSHEEIEEPLAIFGTIRPRRVAEVAERQEDRGVAQQHVARRNGDTQLSELGGTEEDGPVVVTPFSSDIGGGGGIGKLLKKLFGERRSGEGGPPGADSPTHWSHRGTRIARTLALSTSTDRIPEGTAAAEQKGITYPEWDHRTKRYKLDWCTVVAPEPLSAELAPFVPPDTHALRRPLARLGMELERHHRQLQGDDIDIDAAVEAQVEFVAGSAPDEAVYIDTLRRRRDLSVLVLLDVSGSAGEPSVTGVSVHEHQRAAAAALTVALHELGDRVALYGFRSQGRSAVHVLPVKRFGDDLDELVMQRIGGFAPCAYTRLGAAIRHGAAVLEHDAGTSRRLLIVLSDGFAYDHGYERSYGEADARRALAEARRRGIGCLCLSIGAGTNAVALRRVFGTAAYAAIGRVNQLPAVVGPLFRSALRSAEFQRRVSQRTQRTKDRLEIERRTA